MSSPEKFRVAVVSVVKHAYVANGVAAHPRFELVVVCDDPGEPAWVHERNEEFAAARGLPYVRDVEKALRDYKVQVACISTQAERHCDLAVRASNLGIHVVQDKPMSTRRSECDRVVEAMARNKTKFMMWNRNGQPALLQTKELIDSGAIGKLRAIHVDFYFAKDAGIPKGARKKGFPPVSWLAHQVAAHADGSDGGVGSEPMGELKIEGIYPLAYIRGIVGREVQQVFARTTPHFHQLNVDNNVEDLGSVTLELEDEIVGTLCIGRIGRASHMNAGELRLWALGTEGAISIQEPRPEIAVFSKAQGPRDPRHRKVDADNDFILMESFARAIDTGGRSMMDEIGGRQIAATVEAALESARTGVPVRVS